MIKAKKLSSSTKIKKCIAIWRFLFLGFFFILGGVMQASSSTGSKELPPLETVPHVDLEKYLGQWYEIAKFPQWFQRNCDCASATYSMRSDGDIEVLNQCIKEDSEHSKKSSKGKAWVVDTVTQAKLKVRFFWPFSGNYWIIELGKEYEYAVVSEPKREYLWILSRSAQIPDELYQNILSRLKEKGFDLSALTKSRQAPDPACLPVVKVQ